jgi:hypothetical protein
MAKKPTEAPDKSAEAPDKSAEATGTPAEAPDKPAKAPGAIAGHVIIDTEAEAANKAAANAGPFTAGPIDPEGDNGKIDFSPARLASMYAEAGPGSPAMEANLDRTPEVRHATGTTLTQSEMARMIRTRRYENAAKTDNTINAPTYGLETRLGRSLDQPGDKERESKTFQSNLAKMTPEQRARAQEGFTHLMERNSSGALSDAQTSGTLASLNDIMDPKNAAELRARGVDQNQLNDNVASAIQNLGNPAFIRQGQNQSCALDGPIKEMAASNPAAAADLIRQLHVNPDRSASGNPTVTLPGGQKILVDANFARHDSESLFAKGQDGANAGARDVFNRSMTLIMGNAVSQTQYSALYVDRASTGPRDTGERMVAMNDQKGFNSTNYLKYGEAGTGLFVQNGVFDKNGDRQLNVAERAAQQARMRETIIDPLMTNTAAIRLNQLMGLGDQAFNGRRVGTMSGVDTSGDTRNVAGMDALLNRNGGSAVVSLDSRHSLFQSFGQNAGYGGGHTVFNFGEFNINGQNKYIMGTWGKLGAVEKGDLVNAMDKRENHRPVQSAKYDSPQARAEGSWVRDGSGAPSPGIAGPGWARVPQDGRGQTRGQHIGAEQIQDPTDRKDAIADLSREDQRWKDEQDKLELELKEKRTREEEERLTEIRKRIEQDRQRQKKHYQTSA